MKYSLYTIIALSVLLFTACNGKPDRPDSVLNETQKTYDGEDLKNTFNTTQAEPPQNADGVWHYTCPTGCAGGAGAAVPCATCGTMLAHNGAYHQGQNTTTPQQATPQPTAIQPGGVISFDPNNPTQTPTNITLDPNNAQPVTAANANPKPEPPQNAAGVWHYTCPSGCAGGGGAVGPCGKCGATLAHNTAYHN